MKPITIDRKLNEVGVPYGEDIKTLIYEGFKISSSYTSIDTTPWYCSHIKHRKYLSRKFSLIKSGSKELPILSLKTIIDAIRAIDRFYEDYPEYQL